MIDTESEKQLIHTNFCGTTFLVLSMERTTEVAVRPGATKAATGTLNRARKRAWHFMVRILCTVGRDVCDMFIRKL